MLSFSIFFYFSVIYSSQGQQMKTLSLRLRMLQKHQKHKLFWSAYQALLLSIVVSSVAL